MINEIKEKILDEIRCGELNNENGLLPTWLNKPEIPHYAEYMRCFQDGVTCKQYTDAVIVKNIFKEFEKVDVPDTNVGGWIPCSEMLPEDIKTVLVTIEESKEPMLGWYGNKFGWRIVAAEFANIKDFTVLAWMPLPEGSIQKTL